MADFREFIRKESCDSQEYIMRKTAERKAKEEADACKRANAMIPNIKWIIRKQTNKGEFDIVAGKHLIKGYYSRSIPGDEPWEYGSLQQVLEDSYSCPNTVNVEIVKKLF